MAEEVWVFDAAGSNVDGSNPGTALSIGPGTNYPLLEVSFPSPPLNVMYSSSVDTEGEIPVSRRYGNRTINIRVAMDESGANNTLLDALQAKIAKLQREGGTLKRTRKDGSSVRIYDIVAADGWDPVYDLKYLLANSAEVPVALPALPLARTAEVEVGTDTTESTLPYLLKTGSVSGDADALGRYVGDEDSAANQAWITWGIETNKNYTHTTSSGSGALFYEAETRTAIGGSATAAGPAGSSGAGSNVMRNTTLPTNWIGVLSTQASGGGAHLSHVGTFRVYARVQAPTTNTGAVSLSLEWADGDFRRFTQNAPVTLSTDWEGTWRRVDLGLVSPQKVASGTQQWEGRILAKSSFANDDIDIDWIMLIPAEVGSGVIQRSTQTPAPTAFSARDEFDQTAGALTGKTLPIGGTWAGAGDADDFSVSGSGTVTRAAVSDSSMDAGRYVTASTPTLANVVASIRLVSYSNPLAVDTAFGVVARYVDTNNWLMVRFEVVSLVQVVRVLKRVSGTTTELDSVAWAHLGEEPTLAIRADQDGNWQAWAVTAGSALTAPLMEGYDPVLATGGTLDDGKVGIYDVNDSATANTRTYDDFWTYTFPADAAVFASQSYEIRHDRVRREDSGGGMWVPPSFYEGDYMRVPPSGAEGHAVRMIVTHSRGIPGAGADGSIDDLSGRLFVTPRYL